MNIYNVIKNFLIYLVHNNPKGYHIILKNKNFNFIQIFLDKLFPQLQDKKYTIGTKVYWILHDIKDFPKCKRSNCANKLHKNVIVTTGYGGGYCSIYCEMHDDIHKQKVSIKCYEKFGAPSYSQTQAFKDMMTQKSLERSQEEKENINAKREKTNLKNNGIRNVFCKGKKRDAWELKREKEHGSKHWNNSQKAIQTRKRHKNEDPNFQKKINQKTTKTRELHRQLDPQYDNKITLKCNETKNKKC